MAKPKRHNPNTYRSGLETRFQAAAHEHGWDLAYEANKIKYTIPESKHVYTPDFTVTSNVYIETKGLWAAADRKKAVLIKEQHPDISILYVLQRNQGITKSSKTTYLDWAAKHGLEACVFKDTDHWVNFIKRHLP
jgi:predicted nuclease of restriction endonuclease-like RecB superfamily